jgi:hypothetical protein
VVKPVQVLVEAYAGTKQSQDLATATFIGHPASRLLWRRIRTLAPSDMAVTCENFGRADRI